MKISTQFNETSKYQQSLKRKFSSLVLFCVYETGVAGGGPALMASGILANSLEICYWCRLLPHPQQPLSLLIAFLFLQSFSSKPCFGHQVFVYLYIDWLWPSLLNLIGQGSLKYLKVYSPGISICVVYIYIHMYWHISAFNQKKKKTKLFVQVFFLI